MSASEKNMIEINLKTELDKTESNKNNIEKSVPQTKKPINIIIFEVASHENILPNIFLPSYIQMLKNVGIPIAVATEEGTKNIKKMQDDFDLLDAYIEINQWLVSNKVLQFSLKEMLQLKEYIQNSKQMNANIKTQMLKNFLNNPPAFIDNAQRLAETSSTHHVTIQTKLSLRKELDKLKVPFYYLEKDFKDRKKMDAELIKAQKEHSQEQNVGFDILAKYEKDRIKAHLQCVETVFSELAFQTTGGVLCITNLGMAHGPRLEVFLNRLKQSKGYDFTIQRFEILTPKQPVKIGKLLVQIYDNNVTGFFSEISKRVDDPATVAEYAKLPPVRKLMFTQDLNTEKFSCKEFSQVLAQLVKEFMKVSKSSPILLSNEAKTAVCITNSNNNELASASTSTSANADPLTVTTPSKTNKKLKKKKNIIS